MSIESLPKNAAVPGKQEDERATAVHDDPDGESQNTPAGWLQSVSLGSLALLDQIVVSGTNFATTLLLSNLCSQPEMGLFGLAWTIFGFQRTAQERMLSAPYMVFAHRPEQNKSTWLGSSLYHQRVFGISCTAIAWILAVVFFITDRPAGMGPVMLALGLMSSFLLLRDHVRAVCSTHFTYHVSLMVDVATSALQLGGIALLYVCGALTIWSSILVLGAACLLPTAVWLWKKPQPYELSSDRYLQDWKTSWGYSKWLVAARTIGISGLYLVPWIVAFLMDEAAVGTFTVCTNLAGFSLMFIMGINNFFAPRTISAFQTGGTAALVRSLLETLVVFSTILGAVTTLMYFLGDWLLGFYGPEYVGHGAVAFYLCLSILCVGISIAWGNGLAALGKPRGYFLGEVAYFVTAVTLAWFLIPTWELRGASIALVGASLAVSFVTGLVLLRLILQVEATRSDSRKPESQREIA